MLFRLSQDAINLSDYWNALDRGAPPEDLERLAAAIPASDREAIQRVRAMHQPHVPDPQFALRLERILMQAASHPASQAIPLPRIPTHRKRATGRSGSWRPEMSPRTIAYYGSVALRVALVLLMIFLMASGIWLFTRHDGNQQIATPPVATATPTVTTSPNVPMYRGNPARTGLTTSLGPTGMPLELWTVQLDGEIASSPAIVDGVLYIGGGANGIHAFAADTGEPLWTAATDSAVASSPAVGDGLVFVASSSGTMYAVDATTGRVAWSLSESFTDLAPAWVDGVLYSSTDSGFVIALDSRSGDELWRGDLGGDPAGVVSVANGVVYAGTATRLLNAFDANTGSRLWNFQAEGDGGMATPTVANGYVYITTGGGVENPAYALDATTGK